MRYVSSRVAVPLTHLVQAREKHPILERYVNDWATEEIIKQFTKNKRRRCYQKNWLEVPEKYAYLKNNSAKRDPSASRKRRTVAAAPKKVAIAKKAAKKKNAVAKTTLLCSLLQTMLSDQSEHSRRTVYHAL